MDSYKRFYEEMRGKKASMERHVQFPAKFHSRQQQQKDQQGQMTMPVIRRTIVNQPRNPTGRSSSPQPTLSPLDPMESVPYHPLLVQAVTQGHSHEASSALRPPVVLYLSLSNTAITPGGRSGMTDNGGALESIASSSSVGGNGDEDYLDLLMDWIHLMRSLIPIYLILE